MFICGLPSKIREFFMLLSLGMYFQNGLDSSEGDPQVSLYEAALILNDVLKSTDGNENLAPGNQPAVPFQPGVPAITVGRCLLRGKNCAVGKFPENCHSIIAVSLRYQKTSCKHQISLHELKKTDQLFTNYHVILFSLGFLE